MYVGDIVFPAMIIRLKCHGYIGTADSPIGFPNNLHTN